VQWKYRLFVDQQKSERSRLKSDKKAQNRKQKRKTTTDEGRH